MFEPICVEQQISDPLIQEKHIYPNKRDLVI